MNGGLAVVVFLAVFALAAFVVSAADRPFARVETRFERVLRRTRLPDKADGIIAEIEAPEQELSGGEARTLAQRRERLMRLVSERLAGEGFGNRLAQRLRRADLRLQVAEFALIAVGLAIAGVIAGWLVSRALLSAVLGVGGFLAPTIYLNRRLGKRQRALEGQLADGLGLISNSLRSGYSFLQAMDVVAKEMPAPIGKEFEMVLRETRVNIPVEDALRNLVDRVHSPDMDLAVTAMLIQRQIGGNMAEVMDNISATIRDRAKLAAEVSALSATGRMSGWVVAGIPVALVLIVGTINPSFIRPLFTHPIGWAALGIGSVMQTLGIFAISKIVKVKF